MSDCPFPFQKYPVVTLAHGAGGRFTQQLIDDVFNAAFGSVQTEHDGALLTANSTLAFSTDSYVISPLFFPGGDIASLAVTGTCNDLAMCGAQPQHLSCGWIIEEGFATEDLYRLARSMADTAGQIGAQLVTGDTKVVERGKGDGVYLNVSGVGVQLVDSHPRNIRPGDSVLVSGDLGRHGATIMALRQQVEPDSPLTSDCAHLWPTVERIIAAGLPVHCMRDLTRGGLATALVELSRASNLHIAIRETQIPVASTVASLCELFGLDPLYVANEGRMAVVVPAACSDQALDLLGDGARLIGQVENGSGVNLQGPYGATRVLDLLSGEQLPRIC